MAQPTQNLLFAAIQNYYQELLAFVRQKVRSSALAEDVVQAACLRLFSGKIPANIDNPRAYLYRAVDNAATDVMRQDLARARYLSTEPAPENIADNRPDAEKAIAGREQLAILADAVAELPPRCREVFVLRHFDDLDQREIARRLGISLNMVQKHLRKALLHCATRLKDGP